MNAEFQILWGIKIEGVRGFRVTDLIFIVVQIFNCSKKIKTNKLLFILKSIALQSILLD